MREFNTSGPNIAKQHYTIERTDILKKGIKLVQQDRYFTIWAPRQTGKSTYFRQLAEKLDTQGYHPVFFSVEGFIDYSVADVFDTLCRELKDQQAIDWKLETFKDFEQTVSNCTNKKLIIIIDEIESLNPDIFGQFLHIIRNLYHSRHKHCLKSVILVGASNIVGIVQDNASPFNITDNLNVPYFTRNEVLALLHQHEKETTQLFEEKVKNKIYEITAGQPGLVNGFAKVMVDNSPDKKQLDYADYLKTEDWYLTEAIDKNIGNILNKAKTEQDFIEKLLFTEDKVAFKINRPAIKFLHANGLIKKDKDGNVTFWVPLYKKAVFDFFYPYTNGEKKLISRTILADEYFDSRGNFKIAKLINSYRAYIKRRGFKPFMKKDKKGNFQSLKESALIYSFETYINAIVEELEGKIYREALTGLGQSDMILNFDGNEFIFETKVYYSQSKFILGKTQLAYYASRMELKKATYLVFYSNGFTLPENITENKETIEGVELSTYLVEYDETKW